MLSSVFLVLTSALSLATAAVVPEAAAAPNGGCTQYGSYKDPYGCTWVQQCRSAPIESATSYNKTMATDLDNCIDQCGGDARAHGHATGCQEAAFIFKGKHKGQCFFFNHAYKGTSNKVASYAYLSNCTRSA